MPHSLFIHLPTEGRLGCFQVLVIINKANPSLCIAFCMDIKFLTTLDYMVNICLYLKTIAKPSSVVAVPVCISTSRNENSCCYTLLPMFGVIILDFVPFNIAQWCLICNSLMTFDIKNFFSQAYLSYLNLLWWSFCSYIWSFFNQVFYILTFEF